MKRMFATLAITLSITFAGTTGCIKGTNDVVDAAKVIPDLANFVMTAARTFISGEAALIQIASTSLLDGAYTVNYTLSGSNTFSGSASFTMSGGHGSFNTTQLANGGNTTVIINSITNSSGGSANVTTNNSSSFFDSTGNMTATQTLADPFYATDVTASLNGTMLNIEGVMWDPLRTVSLTVYNFNVTGLPKTITFHDISSASIDYNSPSTSTLKHAAHGSITIQSINGGVISGSYGGTWEDSSTVSGNFQGKFN